MGTLIYRDGTVYLEDTGEPLQRTLGEVKADARARIDAAWNAANLTGFLFNGTLVSNDARSQLNISVTSGTVALTGALPADWPGGWKAADDSVIPIPDVETWKAFYAAMVTQGINNYLQAQTYKAAIAAATTADEAQAVEWPS